MIWNISKNLEFKPHIRTKEEVLYYKEHPEEDIFNIMEFWSNNQDPALLNMPNEELAIFQKNWILENCTDDY